MSSTPLDLVFIGLTITSTWGNGHATTYRALVRSLSRRGHRVLFLERDVPWYETNRDLPSPEGCTLQLYRSLDELRDRCAARVRNADAVIVGSYVPEGVAVSDWVFDTARGTTAFYDIDTPVTLRRLRTGDTEYLSPRQVSDFDLYLSFSGGPALRELERRFSARRALPLYCSVDPAHHRRTHCQKEWDLSYLGTYSEDRQPGVDRLLLEPARRWDAGRFVVAGPQYPKSIKYPENVQRLDHLPATEHAAFYSASRFTLNVTRADMTQMGYSPSVRLFEAAACGTPIISDPWVGLGSFFELEQEVLVAKDPVGVLRILHEVSPENARAIADRAHRRLLAEHTSDHRAAQLEDYLSSVRRERVGTQRANRAALQTARSN